MAYLFYAALIDTNLNIYKVYGFDPVAGTWTYILTPGPATISGYGVESVLQRLPDGKTYLALSSSGSSNAPARVKRHDGSWGEITVSSPDIGGMSTYVKAMDRKAFSFPLVGVAVARTAGETRLGLSGVAPIPWLLDGEQALDTATPLPQNAYKIEIAKTLVKRAILNDRHP